MKKIAEKGGPLTLPEEIGGSIHVAQIETTTMTSASARLRNVHTCNFSLKKYIYYLFL